MLLSLFSRLCYALGCIVPYDYKMQLLRRYLRSHAYTSGERWEQGEVEPFEFTNEDERIPITLRGRIHRPKAAPRGSIFILHGFRCTSEGKIPEARFFAAPCGLVSVAWDARGHGQSDAAVPTFGPREVGDVRAALAQAEKLGLPRPYLFYGSSMGAMAARAAAKQIPGIAGVILIHAPASLDDVISLTPMPELTRIFMREFFVRSTYGDSVFRESRSDHQQVQAGCSPYVLEISGMKEIYDEARMRAAFECWPGAKAYNCFPSETAARCVRYTFPNTGHPGSGVGRSADQPEFPRLLREAVERALERVQQGHRRSD